MPAANQDRAVNAETLNNWIGGVNSLLPPWALLPGQYAWAENVINRGGLIQTRPGRRIVASLLGKNPQGFTIFQPTGSQPVIVAAVDGLVYQMAYPKFVPVQIPNIQFNAQAPMVYFQATVKSYTRNPDNSLKVITPYNVLIMQDGAYTNAAFWDGVNSRHLNPNAPQPETPSGSWMAWIMDRLWIVDGATVLVGDLADPLSNQENVYLSERSSFTLPDVGTGLLILPNRSGLLAFCAQSTTLFQANISNRTTWDQTPNFQAVIYQDVGCVAGRTAVNQYGMAYWMSDKGLVSLDNSFSANRSSRLIAIDENMLRSRRKLAPDMSASCAINWGNFLLCSVPSGSRYNEHTWVYDQSPNGANSAPVWAANWTGTRPVQWANGNIGGKERLYQLSFDKSSYQDTQIHIWEDMRQDKQDAGGHIQCGFVTGIITSTNPIAVKSAILELSEILGDVGLQVYVGGIKGPLNKIGNFNLQAEEGCFGSSVLGLITSDSVIQAYKPQARRVKTEEFNLRVQPAASPEQKPYNQGIDKGFYLCFVWSGRMGVREINLLIGDAPVEAHGAPSGVNNGQEIGQVNVINESGLVVTPAS